MKAVTAKELGTLIYQAVQMGLASSTDLSCEVFMKRLGMDLANNGEAEIILGLLFSAGIATIFEYNYQSFKAILDGIRTEFLRHSKELGATQEDADHLDVLFIERMRQYSSFLSDKPEDEARILQNIARQYYANVTGSNEEHTLGIAEARSYLLAASAGVRAVLREFRLGEVQ